MERKSVKQRNPFTGAPERYEKFGPRAKPRPPVKLPEALDTQIAEIMRETGLGFSSIAIRALARYADWYFKRHDTPGVVEQRPAIIEQIVKSGENDPDPF